MTAEVVDLTRHECWTCGYPNLRPRHAEWCVGRVYRYYLDNNYPERYPFERMAWAAAAEAKERAKTSP